MKLDRYFSMNPSNEHFLSEINNIFMKNNNFSTETNGNFKAKAIYIYRSSLSMMNCSFIKFNSIEGSALQMVSDLKTQIFELQLIGCLFLSNLGDTGGAVFIIGLFEILLGNWNYGTPSSYVWFKKLLRQTAIN